MKAQRISLSARYLRLALIATLISCTVSAQVDTLHLYYVQVQTKLQDSAAKRIDDWVKKLNGKHVDIDVVAYYSRPEFRKYAQERCDDLFLLLNRKARALITIKSNQPKKGENWQRSMVDVIYRPTVSPEEAKAAAAQAEAEKAAKKEAEKAEKEKAAKEKQAAKGEKTKSEVVAEQSEKGKKEKSGEEKKEEAAEGKNDEKGDGEDEDFGQASSRTFSDGYSISGDEVKYIKRSMMFVAQTGRKEVDESLLKAVRSFWDFTSDIEVAKYDEIREKAKENKKDTLTIISFIQVKTWFPVKRGPVTVRIPYFGYAVCIETGRGHTLLKQFINKEKGMPPKLVNFASAVSYMNDLCKIMDENNFAKSGKADMIYDERASELSSKTLYIGDGQLHPELPVNDIPNYYTSPLKVVSDAEREEAILEKKDVAYSFVIETPNPEHTCFHYIMDAKTGRVILFDYPKFGVMGIKNASNSGKIDKPNFERYEKGIKKAIADAGKRSEAKAQKAEKDSEKAAKKQQEAEAKKAKEQAKAAEKESAKEEKSGGEEKKREGKKGKKDKDGEAESKSE